MKSSCTIQTGPKSKEQYPYRRREETQGEGQKAMQGQGQGGPGATRSCKRQAFFLRGFRGSMALPTP